MCSSDLRATDPDAVAVSNAVAAGVVVVSAAGNAGSQLYLMSSPGTGAGVVSVAANDPMENYPAAQLTIDGKTIQTINLLAARQHRDRLVDVVPGEQERPQQAAPFHVVQARGSRAGLLPDRAGIVHVLRAPQ